ncbi:hypothetical protein H7X65_02175 [Candidatus Parcubacteria bacterium]|nr:hypothetical protein [Candidatus Parcubacteria bacterium]
MTTNETKALDLALRTKGAKTNVILMFAGRNPDDIPFEEAYKAVEKIVAPR